MQDQPTGDLDRAAIDHGLVLQPEPFDLQGGRGRGQARGGRSDEDAQQEEGVENPPEQSDPAEPGPEQPSGQASGLVADNRSTFGLGHELDVGAIGRGLPQVLLVEMTGRHQLGAVGAPHGGLGQVAIDGHREEQFAAVEAKDRRMPSQELPFVLGCHRSRHGSRRRKETGAGPEGPAPAGDLFG